MKFYLKEKIDIDIFLFLRFTYVGVTYHVETGVPRLEQQAYN